MEQYTDLLMSLKEYLKSQIAPQFYDDMIKDINEIYKVEGNKIYIKVNSLATKTRIESFLGTVIANFMRRTKSDMVFKLTTDELIKEEYQKQLEINTPMPVENNYALLNKLYTFENFVIGKTNRLAYNGALRVADQPGVFANPLYIFGDVGLGKTHLMQAIGNYILENEPELKVVYVKSQDFIDEYKNAVSKNRSQNAKEEFDRKYYDADVLLVDDIQMLAKKEFTQEAFFQIFEKLYSMNKQIVITSDKPASELQGIMHRLTSRFSMGFVFDVGFPDLETRIKILELKTKMKTNSVEVSKDVLEYIAENFTKSIRDLEGALNRVLFYAVELNDGEIDLECTKEALAAMTSTKEKIKEINDDKADLIDKTFELVCDYYNVSRNDVLSSSKKSCYLYPRQVIMYILRFKFNLEFTKIGELFQGRKHSTVMNSVDKIVELRKNDKNMDNLIDSICQKIS